MRYCGTDKYEYLLPSRFCGKTRIVWLPDVEKKFDDRPTFSCLDRIPACDRQTQRRTDGQTSCHGIRAMHTRRAVKMH